MRDNGGQWMYLQRDTMMPGPGGGMGGGSEVGAGKGRQRGRVWEGPGCRGSRRPPRDLTPHYWPTQSARRQGHKTASSLLPTCPPLSLLLLLLPQTKRKSIKSSPKPPNSFIRPLRNIKQTPAQYFEPSFDFFPLPIRPAWQTKLPSAADIALATTRKRGFRSASAHPLPPSSPIHHDGVLGLLVPGLVGSGRLPALIHLHHLGMG